MNTDDSRVESEVEDSPSPEASPDIEREFSVGRSPPSAAEPLAMARSTSRKSLKRAKPASQEKKNAKKAKVEPVVPSPPQSESPPSLTSEPSSSQKADSRTPESQLNGVQPKLPDFVIVDSLLIHEDTYAGEKSIPCFCKLPEKIPENYKGCGDTCVNRASKFECGSRCPAGQYCSNKKFQKKAYAPVEAFYCGPQKGWGVRATDNIDEGDFITEYVGELIGQLEYYRRRWMYAQDPNHRHHYFMSASVGDVIDATKYGSISRFINHSCNPNCKTDKWMVKRRCRIGFFATRSIKKGEEIVFNYQFRSAGEPQKCYCGAPQCQGYIGVQQAPRVEKEPSDDESDIDFAELEPTKIVEGLSTPSEEEKPKKRVVKKTKKELNKRRSARKAQNQPTIEMVTAEELDEFTESGCRLRNAEHVIAAVKLMLRLEGTDDRIRFLDAILVNNNEASNLWRLFIENEICSILSYWFHPDVVNDSGEYLLKLSTFASWLPLAEQKQVRDSGLLEKVAKVLHGPEEAVIQDVLDSLLEELCGDSARSITRQARLKTEQLLEKWSNLKVFNRIPKKGRVEAPTMEGHSEGRPQYEMKSILRPSYSSNDPSRTSEDVSQQRVSTLRYPDGYHRQRPWMQHTSSNNNDSPSDDATSDDDDDSPTIRSVVGNVNTPTLNLQIPFHPPRLYNRTYNRIPFRDAKNGQPDSVKEHGEDPAQNPSAVGPRTPNNDPPNHESPQAGEIELSRFSRRSRFSRFSDCSVKQNDQMVPPPMLITPLALGTGPISAPVSSSSTSSPSVSTVTQELSADVKPSISETTDPSWTAPTTHAAVSAQPPIRMAFPPPSMMHFIPPPNLEQARRQLIVLHAHMAYLTAFIDQQEAAERRPVLNLEARLSEFAQDVEVPEVSPAQEANPVMIEEIQSTSIAVPPSSQDNVITPKNGQHSVVACSSADTTGSSETRAKFKADIAKFVQSILEPHRKKLFKSADDFKYLTRKLTHTILEKEEKNNEDLRVTDGVKKKSKEYVTSYIKKFKKYELFGRPKGAKLH
ncbi:hypothetical protein QR680_009617 [Steinernema hermaphroditum]|uniref:[histone H3]-lysine(36) N-trimethyltransferase n=1 Tax=Steinernema hermaphroditum TaxID=289476 RepID=A0AA39MA88_9BILA|nr:hypothetical protein QR680_009617 [Steinernema hermaphroditum]